MSWWEAEQIQYGVSNVKSKRKVGITFGSLNFFSYICIEIKFKLNKRIEIMKNGKKYGTHNSCTYAPLLGFQKLLYPFAVIFSRCQSKTLYAQFNKGVRLFDIQISKKHNKSQWYISHGGLWYDKTFEQVLQELEVLAKNDDKVYIRLGLDYHWGNKTTRKEFFNYIKNVIKPYINIIIDEIYIEKPWEIALVGSLDKMEKYWSVAWARKKCDKWWKFYFYIPIPILWSRIYKKQWIKESEEHDYLMTDFI